MEIRFRHILFVVIILLCGTQAVGQEVSDSLRIHFQQSKSLFNESVAGNSQFYGSLADLLCRLAMPNDKESEDRMFAQLKVLDGGKPYRYMYSRLFPELRKAGVKVVAVYRVDDLVSDSRTLLEAAFVEPAEIRISTGVDVMPEAQKKPWYAGVKTNMLYDALLVPNGGLEIYLGKNWSIDAYWMYAWWKSDRVHNYWRTYGGDVELRKWLGSAAKRKPLTGHHIGAYAQIVTYDFELGGRGYLADRWSYAAGVSYGYSLPVAKRLNIDFSIGLGYMGGEYKEYLPQDGHYVWQSTKRRHWIGPTKAEISLVWLIGRGNTNKTK